ncbi:hypothetical protein ACI2KR_08390 [Pseudomonas luteola]
MKTIKPNDNIPFLERSDEEQGDISQALLYDLEYLVTEQRSDEILALKHKMVDDLKMPVHVFQEHLEELYNKQFVTIIDDFNGTEKYKKAFLTAIPVTFIPDHDLKESIQIQSTLGSRHAEWSSELLSAMVGAGYLRATDDHYVVPGLFDINELYATPESSYGLITDVITNELPEKYSLSPFWLTPDQISKTRYFVLVTTCDDQNTPSAIIPRNEDAFTEFAEMQQTIESIITHYWNEHSDTEFEASVIVSPPLPGSISQRLKYPSEMLGMLCYHAIKITSGIDIRDTTVVVEKNTVKRSFMINLFYKNECILSFSYPQMRLADGFEDAMVGYILDTLALSHYRFIEVQEETTPKDMLMKPLIKLV